MRLIDADKIYVIPAEDDNVTGMGMTREEQDAYNDGVEATMAKIRNAKTIDPYKDVLKIIDREENKITDTMRDSYTAIQYIKYAVRALQGGDKE